MKKKKAITGNYLKRIPIRNEAINWTMDDSGNVTLEIENKGIFNHIAQKLFKKPKISYIHLDEMGSFIFPLLDGEKDILALGEEIDKRFGSDAHPLYERLAKYFHILDSYHFIIFKDNE